MNGGHGDPPSGSNSQDLERLARTVRAVAEEATEWEASAQLPEKIIRDMAAAGIFGAPISRDFGGLGLSQLEWGKLNCELARVSSSLRTLVTVHTGLVALTLQRWGDKAQKNIWLPTLSAGQKIAAFALSETGAGSDAAAMTSRYTEEVDGFLLTGEKLWVSFGDRADLFLVFADGLAGPGAFIVPRDTPGLQVAAIGPMMSLRATAMASLRFDKCRIARTALLGRLGSGFSIIASTALDYGRYSVAWGGVGLAQACLEASVKHVLNRQQFGQSLSEFQLVRKLIADMALEFEAARSMAVEAGRSRDRREPQSTFRTNLAKQTAARAANATARSAIQAMGALGMTQNGPVERHFRDAKSLEVIEGTDEIQTQMISEYLFSNLRSFLHE